jgi:hypothetical protein
LCLVTEGSTRPYYTPVYRRCSRTSHPYNLCQARTQVRLACVFQNKSSLYKAFHDFIVQMNPLKYFLQFPLFVSRSVGPSSIRLKHVIPVLYRNVSFHPYIVLLLREGRGQFYIFYLFKAFSTDYIQYQLSK